MTIDIFKRSYDCLMLDSPREKVVAVQNLNAECRQQKIFHNADLGVIEIAVPGRPQKPTLVAPGKVPRRRLGSEQGRAALVHAIAHIEFNAINLALDAVYRFRGLPDEYYLDWLSVAADESRHFLMLRERLVEMEYDYGDFPAHNGLWQMALDTSHDGMIRMALVPRVLEARGLDVTPGMIERLQSVGDSRTVEILTIILAEEIGHVEVGSRWFRWWCAARGLEPDQCFLQLLDQYYGAALRGPYNHKARQQAGFSLYELEMLERLGG